MAFETYEDSDEGGQPVELYEFYYLTQISRWTSYHADITVASTVYKSASLSRSDVTDAGGTLSNQNLTITCQPDFPIAELFSVSPPSDVVSLIIKRVQLSDLADPRVIYPGRVLSVSWAEDAAKLTCQSIITRLKQPGLRRIYGKMCPHLLYGQGDGECNVNPLTFQENVALATVSGITVTSAAFAAKPADYYTGGKLEVAVPSGYARRGIQKHVGDTLTLTHQIPELTSGMTVRVFPGCDHTRTTCVSKFNNEPNFGGFPFTPQKNPFGQSSVF